MVESLSVTHARLRELLHYDPETGVFTRRISTGRHGCHKAGDVVGSQSKNGYVIVAVDGRRHMAHRLAWFYVHGEWPHGLIDHKDTIRNHNWIDNLRPADKSLNAQNRRTGTAGASSRFLGVSWYKRHQLWSAKIALGKKVKFLGYFKEEVDAADAYVAAKRKFHPGCTL